VEQNKTMLVNGKQSRNLKKKNGLKVQRENAVRIASQQKGGKEIITGGREALRVHVYCGTYKEDKGGPSQKNNFHLRNHIVGCTPTR